MPCGIKMILLRFQGSKDNGRVNSYQMTAPHKGAAVPPLSVPAPQRPEPGRAGFLRGLNTHLSVSGAGESSQDSDKAPGLGGPVESFQEQRSSWKSYSRQSSNISNTF